MNNTNTNVCVRCGKQRVVSESHKEKVGNAVVTYTQRVCPDSSCQEKVDSQLAKEKEIRTANMNSNTRSFRR